LHRVLQARRLYEWAILPCKQHVDRAAPREEARLLAENFRYHRQFRRADACPPWVMGQELGWVIPSPIAVTLTPLDDVQLAADDAELREAGRLLGRDELWRRGEGLIATARTDWLRAHQYQGHDGAWQGMFLPNGEGSVEWRLGWALRIPEGCFLLVTALDDADGFTVPTGVLTDRQVNRTWDTDGFSIALRPDRPVRLTRGQPVARIVLLSRETLQARIEEADVEAMVGDTV
jgi:hypothetical protein